MLQNGLIDQLLKKGASRFCFTGVLELNNIYTLLCMTDQLDKEETMIACSCNGFIDLQISPYITYFLEIGVHIDSILLVYVLPKMECCSDEGCITNRLHLKRNI